MSTLPKDKFFSVYANLPIGLRDQVILVLPDKGPITWNVAYIEVSNNTKLGDVIVEKLIEFKII